jgi:predicted short-subunit dehydrogenase-like oxidoreductase (DUF2520 family)
MNRVAPFALLAAGKIRDSFLLRVPRLAERLGPVRSSSFRLASRISNFLGAGYSVESFDEFERSRVILVAMPKPWLPVIVEELAGLNWDWKTKTVLLCDGPQDSTALERLALRGAATGSIVAIPPVTEAVYLVEGDRRALREARTLVGDPGTRMITMARGQRALFEAGMSFATSLALPLLIASAESLRASGINQNDAQFLVERLFQKTLRGFLKGGRKAWEGPLSVQDCDQLLLQVQALFRESPLLATYFFENAVLVSQVFKQDPAWLHPLAAAVYPEASSQ